MPASEKLQTLVAQMPDPDDRGMYTQNIDKARIESALAEILQGGRENIQGLIDLLGAPGSDADVKPHYALHGVLNRTLVDGNEPARRMVCETLANNLASDRPVYHRAYFCQELQWAGRDEACPALGAALQDEELVEPASMALAAIGGERAAAPLRAALPQATGRRRLNVLHALVALSDPHSVGFFRDSLADADREVRLAAGAGLARLGDVTAVDILLQNADKASGWEQIQATKHCIVLAERLAAGGKQAEARRVYEHIRATRQGPKDAYLREAAEKALASL